MAVQMQDIEIKSRTRAIVCFGPATDMTGFRPGEYSQVVIDPDMASPSGEYIRFDLRRPTDDMAETCEIHGWQRINALTICEILWKDEKPSESTIHMRAIVKE